MIKRIVCLANSRKLQGRCVAGRELLAEGPGPWIRPVSNREHEEVSEDERYYEDDSDPRLLDIIDVPLIAANPKPHQPENWLLDPRFYWRKVGELRYNNLPALADAPGPLWVNGYHTYNGLNDCVPFNEAQDLGYSLKLIAVEGGVQLRVYRPGAMFGNPKRRVQATFTYSGTEYQLWVTDPMIEAKYLAQADGVHQLGSGYLTISLGEPFEDRCYKLVAAIMEASS